MRIIHLPRCFKKAWNIFLNRPDLSSEAKERKKGLLMWERLRDKGLSSKDALDEVIIAHTKSNDAEYSADSWYRWRARYRAYGPAGLECESRKPRRVRRRQWDKTILNRIVSLRNHDDTCRWGGPKIHIQLMKEKMNPPSIATVERMIAHLKKTRAIAPLSAPKKRTKPLTGCRTRYKKALHGDMTRIQIDVDEYRILGMKFYNFTAIHIRSRWIWSKAYSRATARNALDFLTRMLSSFPPGMIYDAIQVDGEASS